jgi:hypothetical protein
MNQFLVHSSLDLVDDVMWTTSNAYLKVVDRISNYVISAYVSAGGMRFMLLHENIASDSVRAFFQEVHELYIKVCADYY